jgi:hypothetical protein
MMNVTTEATEKSWAFEREPEVEAQKPVEREYTFSIARGLVHIHGMVHSVADVVSALAGKVRTLADRGPKDYAESEFERGVKAGVQYGGYHESPKNGGSSPWHKAILTIACGVALAGILGGVAMYGKLAAVEANQINQQKQLDNLTQMMLNLTRRGQ